MPIKVREGGAWVQVSDGGGGGSSDPVGTIVTWATSTAPTGWLECNGQSTSGYAELAALIGSNVPDLRGEFVRGWDNGAGIDTGRTLGSSQTDAFQGHRHSIRASVPANTTNAGAMDAGTSLEFTSDLVTDPTTDGTNGTPRTSSETRPRNVALMYIIKHTATSGSGGSGGANGTGKLLQVQHTESNAVVNISQQDIVPIVGLSVNITPLSSSSKLLLEANVSSNVTYVTSFGFALGTASVFTRLGGNTNTNSSNAIATRFVSTNVSNIGPPGYQANQETVTYRYLYSQTEVAPVGGLTFHACACSSWFGSLYNLTINDRNTNDMRSTSSITVTEIVL